MDFTWLWAAWMGGAFLLLLAIGKINSVWRFRRLVGGMTAALYITSFPLLAVSHVQVGFGAAIALVSLYLLLNSLRLVMNRFHQNYLQRSALNTASVLTSLVGLLVAGSLIWQAADLHLATYYAIGFLLCVSAVLGGFFVVRARLALHRYAADGSEPQIKMHELPTVSLVIPARNETHALEDMLTRAVKSDYPKLEILVLDDCSQDATAEVIRSFAHDGVRFVQGKVPAKGWLGKNYACEILAQQASGDLLLFAGVDTHFGSQSISFMVNSMVHHKAEMLSVLPTRREFDAIPAFFEQLRNFWQLVLPMSPRHIPVSSPCWAIWNDSLRRLGGFRAFKSSVFPEVHFAKGLVAKHAYRFVVSNTAVAITTRKRVASQFETATRTFYPLLKRQPARVLLLTTVLASLLLLPFGVLLWHGARTEFDLLTLLAFVAVVLLTVAHVRVLRATSPRAWLFGLVNFPILAAIEIALYNWSMLQFEFGEVNWKGRNVCYPIMEAIPMRQFEKELQQHASGHRLSS